MCVKETCISIGFFFSSYCPCQERRRKNKYKNNKNTMMNDHPPDQATDKLEDITANILRRTKR